MTISTNDLRITALRLALESRRDSGLPIADILNAARAFEQYIGGESLEPSQVATDKSIGMLAAADMIKPTKAWAGLISNQAQSRLAEEATKVINQAMQEAFMLGGNKIQPQHILLALTKNDGIAGAALVDVAGTANAVRKAVISRLTEKP